MLANIRSKAEPLLKRRVNSNLQDVCLLLKPEEVLSCEGYTNGLLEIVTKLPLLPPTDLMLRWVNHLLRCYNEAKSDFDLE